MLRRWNKSDPVTVETPGSSVASSVSSSAASSAKTAGTAAGMRGAPSGSTRAPREGAKNRPTPKRKEQEAARRRPLVQNDPKAARTADRAARREIARQTREAMITGDEKGLPARDQGPVRRYVRDVVDGRLNPGELLLPLMLAVLLLSFAPTTWATYAFMAVYLVILASLLDVVLLWRRTKPRILERFGADTPTRGLAMYLATRAFQMRRTRLPRPMVERGQAPR